MAVKNKTVLKSYFETGDVPTQTEFESFIESAPSWFADVNHIALVAPISNELLCSIVDTGMYRISFNANIRTPANVSSILGGNYPNSFNIIYTDGSTHDQKQMYFPEFPNRANNDNLTSVGGSMILYCDGASDVLFNFDWISVGATDMQYDIYVYVEQMVIF